MECFYDHLIPNPFLEHIPASQRLQQLLQTRRAWSTLIPSYTSPISLEGATVYELKEGLWVSGKPPEADRDLVNELVRYEMPESTEKQECAMEGIRIVLDMETMDFCISPSDDLLILIENRTANGAMIIHLRTLSENRPHPAAAKPILEIPHQESLLIMHLHGDNIVATQFPEEDFGVLPGVVTWWNWRTGKVVRDYPHGISALFLSPTTLAILVYEESLFSVHILSSSQDSDSPSPLAKFMFPQCTSAPICPYAFGSDPSYQYVQPTSPISHPKPTRIAESADLLCIQSCRQLQPDYLVFFRRSTLLKRFEELVKEKEGEEWKWKDWGEDISRWVEAPDAHTYEGSIHGLRFVTTISGVHARKWRKLIPKQAKAKVDDHSWNFEMPLTSGDGRKVHDGSNMSKWRGDEMDTSSDEEEEEEDYCDDDDAQYLFVLDFNPYPIARGATTYSSKDVDCIVMLDEVIKGWGEEDVYSRMPFRAFISRKTMPPGVDDVVIDGDCVVGIEMKEEGDDEERPLLESIRVMHF